MKTYTKESLIEALKGIRDQGWIPTGRKNNDGGVGNTLEDLLGIEENNLPLPNAAEWDRTKIGHLHPSGAGRCTYQYKIPKLPASRYWITGSNHIGGGAINRKETLKNHCPYYGG